MKKLVDFVSCCEFSSGVSMLKLEVRKTRVIFNGVFLNNSWEEHWNVDHCEYAVKPV